MDSVKHRLTPHQAKYYAYELQRSYANDHVGKLAGLLFDAQVEPKPHQIDAALFALQTPFQRGIILADEVGLGKTIEAGIVITQYWAERKRRMLIISPSSLRQQWKQELWEKFLIPSELMDARNKDEMLTRTNQQQAIILICSYEFARRYEASLLCQWDLVIADEAHRLRNYYTGKTKLATAVSNIVKQSNKTLLLTATPLQNRLEELYGLVTVFDSEFFSSLDAFRERYIKNQENDLPERIAEISKRTLRKEAEKYIHFTKRLPVTVEFTPSPDEIKLYEKVNSYLQKDELFAFSKSQRHLSSLVIRKRLGSSTYATASTLENIADRLQKEIEEGKRRDNRGGIITSAFADDELTEEEQEAWEEIESNDDSLESLHDDMIEKMNAEVIELRDYASLARSIVVNQKATKLKEAIDLGFTRLRELGAPEKAIIFTDSTKTQSYIAESLRQAGYGEGLVLFNGTNNSPEVNEIYKNWLVANEDSDIVTGIISADRRKAIVDYFRDKGRIMVATEAAAEGINLQFCAMIVNYDLPWNPQRVEQRIGRAHRFGQQFDVVVVNFSNKGNIVEARILELLTNKFHLFESVFGASDEILGAIEDGFDFEKKINDILLRSRSDEDILGAFDELEKQYASEISTEMAATKTKVFGNLDPHVQDRLKAYDTQSGEMLNKFERLLLAVTQRELKDYADFEGDGRCFFLKKSPVKEAPTGRYYFKSCPIERAHQYRYSSELAQHVVESAKSTITPTKKLVFSISASERVSADVKALQNKSGELVVKVITFSMKARNDTITESYMLAGALTDEGDWLDHEYVAHLLDLTCVEAKHDVVINESRFTDYLEKQRIEFEKEVQGRNARYYGQQEDLLYRHRQDRKAEYEARIREYQSREKEHRRLANHANDAMEQLRHKKEARVCENRVEELQAEYQETNKKLREEADQYLSMIEQALKGTQQIEHLFGIRWSITA